MLADGGVLTPRVAAGTAGGEALWARRTLLAGMRRHSRGQILLGAGTNAWSTSDLLGPGKTTCPVGSSGGRGGIDLLRQKLYDPG